VDFSGARDAGAKVWIAAGRLHHRRLRVERCLPARDLPGGDRARAAALTALCRFILDQGWCAAGFDFPAALPLPLLDAPNWLAFLGGFADRFRDEQQFRELCRAAASGCELRRRTDRETHTPFCPYNLRLYRQTYYGIRDVLRPLVLERGACFLPMQAPAVGRPWLLEVCPASTLRAQNLRFPYKGQGASRRAARERILTAIEQTAGLRLAERAIGGVLLDNPGGDALDAVTAALATARAVRTLGPLPTEDPHYRLEGYVYL
jgi:hypothetical protein